MWRKNNPGTDTLLIFNWMELTSLTAISPVDGRYRKQVQHLDEYFSEFALIKYRVLVEIEYFLFLGDKKFFTLSQAVKKKLQKVAEDFSLEDAESIKKTESITNHDVKAVEYFLKTKLEEAKAGELKEWVHETGEEIVRPIEKGVNKSIDQ